MRQLGLVGLLNGDLLRGLTDLKFDVLVTVDRGIEHQQNLARYGVGLVVLGGRTNRMEVLLPLVDGVIEAVGRVRPDEVIHIPADSPRRRRVYR